MPNSTAARKIELGHDAWQKVRVTQVLKVFVSSTCRDLRDLRAGIRDWLLEHGMEPFLSEETGFPQIQGMPPWATCLRALESCPLVVVVIDKRYGLPIEDWGPYPQYKSLAPTHAELRHALSLGKKALIYVHDDLWVFYEAWLKNSDAFRSALPDGLDEGTLRMFQELKERNPQPWITRFRDVSDVRKSLGSEFVNQLYAYLTDLERQATDIASYLLEKIETAAPEVKYKIVTGLNPTLVAERNGLEARLDEIIEESEFARGFAEETTLRLQSEKANVERQLHAVSEQLQRSSVLLSRAALRDFAWLDHVRRTMMPKQPGRIPFHNSLEVALRGYNAAGGGRGVTPTLNIVTWAKVAETENNLHRGYHAAIIFEGKDFVPGVTVAHRRRGAGEDTYKHWLLPNTYFGDYLELASSDNEPESPLSWRDYEFAVKNPEGKISEWVLFAYPFDDVALHAFRKGIAQQGAGLLNAGKAAEAIEPLRKAFVFADRILGMSDPETLTAKSIWERARNEAALARLRYRPGVWLRVIAGEHMGKSGLLLDLKLNHVHAYHLRTDDREEFLVSDDQVDVIADAN